MSERVRLIDASLHEDDVRVTRHDVRAGYVSDEVPANAFQELEIDIPLRGEEVDIRKRPVVREVVVVSKSVRERDVSASGRLRREELRVSEP